MNNYISILILLSSIWVLVDSKQIGVRKGLVSGFFNMGPWAWFFGCILLWIVCFPAYLIKRNDLKKAAYGSLSVSPAGLVFCRACGRQVHSSAPHCPGCGTPQ